jgi:hypothetical protein
MRFVWTVLLDLIYVTVITSVATSAIQRDCDELLRSLVSVETRLRYHRVGEAHSKTLEWLFQKNLNLGSYRGWSLGWACTGVGATLQREKSTLMKWLYEDSRTIQAIDLGASLKIRYGNGYSGDLILPGRKKIFMLPFRLLWTSKH